MTASIILNVSQPYWPAPSLPGGQILHWSDPWGNGDLYQTPAGDWFLWWGERAQPLTAANAAAWMTLARRRQRERYDREMKRVR